MNGFSGELNGVVAGRFNVLARIARTSGQSFFTGSGLLDTYTGSARIGYDVTRRLEAYAEYMYYVYDTGAQGGSPEIPIAPGVPIELERHGARAGLSLRVPAFRR